MLKYLFLALKKKLKISVKINKNETWFAIMQRHKYVIQCMPITPDKPPQVPLSCKRPNCSKSPSPASSTDSTHFHKCENMSCLQQLGKHNNAHRHSLDSSGSYKSEARLLIEAREQQHHTSMSPTRITLKLLPEHRLAYKNYCNAQGHKRSCSWTDAEATHSSSNGKEKRGSPFTCIETISIKNTSPRFLSKKSTRATRSLRSTPVRTITISPFKVKHLLPPTLK